MSLATIRTKIATYIKSATSLTNTVYEYKRYASDLAKYADLFKENDIIHTWDIQRVGFSRQHNAGHGGVVIINHVFNLRGFYRLNDKLGSEKTFNDIVDLVCEQFEDNPQLEGEAQVVGQPIEGSINEEMFAHVLCHKAEIELNIQQRRIF